MIADWRSIRAGLQPLLAQVEAYGVGPIVGIQPLCGGRTAQVVLRLIRARGEPLVLKAAPPAAVDGRLDWPAELEREIELYATRPELAPWRPELCGHFQAAGWRGLLMQDLGPSGPPPPWTPDAVQAVATGLAQMHLAAARGGGPLAHGDVRSDNLFLLPGRRLALCDWAEAADGSGLGDAVYWAIGVELEGGCARGAYARYSAIAGEVDPGRLGAVIVELTRLTQQRLECADLPSAARRLRRRELDALRRWAGATSSGVGV